jgi:hypothetical protein
VYVHDAPAILSHHHGLAVAVAVAEAIMPLAHMYHQHQQQYAASTTAQQTKTEPTRIFSTCRMLSYQNMFEATDIDSS